MSVWNAIVKANVGDKATEASKLQSGESEKVHKAITEYNNMFKEDDSEVGRSAEKIEERKNKYAHMVNHYYDLVTDFYEYGWGQSFHFAPRFSGESFEASIARHEHYLSARLGLVPGMKVMDAGCGVGGPMRAIARFSGANVVGVNNNDYQVKRSNILNQKYGLDHLCSTVKGDFMNLPFPDKTFDRVYAIEATCHAPDKVGCYKQMHRVLKDEGVFAGYEWVMTDAYDEKSDLHNRIKHGVEKGDGLPDLPRPQVVIDSLKKAGFVDIEWFDLAEVAKQQGNDIPWYATLQGGLKLSQIKHSKIGRFLTQRAVEVLETIKIAPKGTSETHHMLSSAADALAQGGELGIFTPMLFFIAHKPAAGKKQ